MSQLVAPVKRAVHGVRTSTPTKPSEKSEANEGSRDGPKAKVPPQSFQRPRRHKIKSLDQVQVLADIGKGSFGKVVRAIGKKSGAVFAVKVGFPACVLPGSLGCQLVRVFVPHTDRTVDPCQGQHPQPWRAGAGAARAAHSRKAVAACAVGRHISSLLWRIPLFAWR